MKPISYSCFGVEEGSFLYKSFRYPAGEMQVRLTKDGFDMAKAEEIEFLIRIKTADDLVTLAHLKNAVDGVNPSGQKVLRLAYFPYARADRRFVDGDCFGLEVFANLINAMNFDRVVTLDAHSVVLEKLVKNVMSLPATIYIHKAIARFTALHNVKHLTVLYPDEGAQKRYGLPLQIGNNVNVVHLHAAYCTKKRDSATGKLSGFEVPDLASKYSMIVDDLCDGGGTFLGISEAGDLEPKRTGLYVTHGIFSQGVDKLAERFSSIYTTNSYREDLDSEKVVVFDAHDAR